MLQTLHSFGLNVSLVPELCWSATWLGLGKHHVLVATGPKSMEMAWLPIQNMILFLLPQTRLEIVPVVWNIQMLNHSLEQKSLGYAAFFASNTATVPWSN